MKKSANLHFWKNRVNVSVLMQSISWHLKMQSSVGMFEFEHFLINLMRYVESGGEHIFDYAREHKFESEFQEFLKAIQQNKVMNL